MDKTMDEIDYCNPPIYNKDGVEISSPSDDPVLKFYIIKLAVYYKDFNKNKGNNLKHELKQQHKPIRIFLENTEKDYSELLNAMLFTFQDQLYTLDALNEIGEDFINCEIKAIEDAIEINKTLSKHK